MNNLPKDKNDLKMQICSYAMVALKTKMYFDNYDIERFGPEKARYFDGLKSTKNLLWFLDNLESIFKVLQIFSSEYSKKLYLSLLIYRIVGHLSEKICVQFDETSEDFSNYMNKERSSKSLLSTNGMFGSLKNFNFEYEGKKYDIDCLGLKYYLHRRQYFYNQDNVKIMPAENDYVIDAGACFGETAIIFAKYVGKNGYVYSFDPIKEHIEIMNYNIQKNPDCNVKVFPYGISNADIENPPLSLGKYSPGFSVEDNNLPLIKIDTLFEKNSIKKVDFIKMDIEGSELYALKGAKKIINKFKPKLAISIYHKDDDFFEIPLYLNENFPFYEFYLGHYSIHREETVLYAISK